MKRIQEDFKLKDYNIEPLDIYLGAKLDKMKLYCGKYCCTMLPEKYVKSAVTNVEEGLSRHGKIFPSKFVTRLSKNSAPWLEDSPELMVDGVQKYQERISQIRWAAEIVILEILLETSLLLSYLSMPLVGHFKQAFHIFGYLKAYM